MGNDFSIKGIIDINSTPANSALATTAKALRSFQADTDKTTESVKVEAAAMKAMASTADALVASYARATKASATLEAQSARTAVSIREQQLAGINSRSNARAITSANVSAIQDVSQAKVDVAGSQAVLNASRAQSEELRQQIALSNQLDTSRLRQAQIEGQIARNQALAASEAERSIARQTQSLSSLSTAAGRVSQTLALGGAIALGAGILPTAAAASFQKAFAQVTRTVGDGSKESAIQLQYLKEQFVELSQTIPVSFKDISQIGALAGQLGIAEKDVSNFTTTVAEFGATSNVSAEDAGTAFGRLNSLLPDVKGNFTGLADSILNVGVNSVATESQIIAITTQLSSVTGAANFSSKATIGLAGALASVGAAPEISRGTITRTFTQIQKAIDANGPALEQFGKIAGESGQQFKDGWQSDAAGTFEKFMQGIMRSGDGASAALRAVGITSVRDVPLLERLANASDAAGKKGGLLAQTMNDAANAGGTLGTQYGIVANTVSAKMQILVNNVVAAFAQIGESNLGFVADLITNISNAVKDFGNSLKEPAKLFGIFNTGLKNSDILGWAAGAAVVVGVLGLLVAVLAKGAQGFFALQNIIGKITGSSTAAAASTARLAETQVAAAASATEMSAAQSRATASTLTLGEASQLSAVGTVQLTEAELAAIAASNVYGGANVLAAGSALTLGEAETIAATEIAAAGAAATITAGETELLALAQSGVAAKAASGFSAATAGVSRAASTAGGAISGLASAIGPQILGAAAIAGTIAILNAQEAATKLGSTASEVGNTLGTSASATDALSNIQTTKVGLAGLFVVTGKAVQNVDELKIGLNNLNATGANTSGFLGFLNGRLQETVGIFGSGAGGLNEGMTNTNETIEKLDQGFTKLGQDKGASVELQKVSTLAKTLTDTQLDQFLGKATGVSQTLTDTLSSLGIEATAENMRDAARGTGAYAKAVVEATGVTSTFVGELGGDTDAITGFLTDVGGAIASIGDQGAAYTDALTKAQDAYKAAQGDADTTTQAYQDGLNNTSASIDDFLANLSTQAQQQKDFTSDLQKLVLDGLGPDLIDGIAKQGPVVGGAIADMLANASDAQRQQYIDSMTAVGADGAQAAAIGIANTSGAIALAGKIGGQSAIDGVKEGIQSGAITVTDAFTQVATDATPDFIAAVQKLGPQAANQIASDLAAGKTTVQGVIDSYDLKMIIQPGVGAIPATDIQILNAQLDALGIERPVNYTPVVDLPSGLGAASTLDSLADGRTAPIAPMVEVGPLTTATNQLDTSVADRTAAMNAFADPNYLTTAITLMNAAAADRQANINAQGQNVSQTTQNLDAIARAREAYINAHANTAEAEAALAGLTSPRTIYLNTVVNPAGGARESGFYTGGKIPGFAAGSPSSGYKVPGNPPGNPAKDNYFAMLRSNEWVINESASKFYGDDVMSAINDRRLQVNGGGSAYVAAGGSASAQWAGQDSIELSPYDRQILMTIAARVGLVLDTGVVAGAVNKKNLRANRLGGG